ncbi:MAG: dihydrofolate reductase family protein [Gemmatimonadetes bacterium]|nr:dihydrofolate reductase family protein [Gemmatimonadota bacterium]
MSRSTLPTVVATLTAGAILLPTAGCFGGGDGMRQRVEARTAEAPAIILGADTVRMYEENRPRERQDLRHAVRWQFQVGGNTYVDSVSPTLYFPEKPYKVCYDPKDPTNSSIKEVDLQCGKWDGF